MHDEHQNITSFDQLPLSFELLQGLKSKGWHTPSPYQKESLPAILKSRQILTVAPSGSGKSTCLVILPIHEIEIEGPALQAIVICPNRETVMRMGADAKDAGKFLKGRFNRGIEPILPNSNPAKWLGGNSTSTFSVVEITGGINIRTQMEDLASKQPQILFGTPGRVLDLLHRKIITFDNLNFFGLNGLEDCMQVGFVDQLSEMFQLLPKTAKVVIASYTQPDKESGELVTKFFPSIENHLYVTERRISKRQPFYKEFGGDITQLVDLMARLILQLEEIHQISAIQISAASGAMVMDILLNAAQKNNWAICTSDSGLGTLRLKTNKSTTCQNLLIICVGIHADHSRRPLHDHIIVSILPKELLAIFLNNHRYSHPGYSDIDVHLKSKLS